MKVATLFPALCLAAFLVRGQEDARKNWLCGGDDPTAGQFEATEEVIYPWTGVDEEGFLRKAVALPACHPFITKSNQFTYAWLGQSASFIDLDADALPDLVAPDGNGMFWFWKNVGNPGRPAFGAGEVMPLLIDDLRSTFAPIFRPDAEVKTERTHTPGLSPGQQSEKKRIDERRNRELQRLKRRNERAPKDRRRSDKELQREVAEMFPYSWEKGESRDKPRDSDPTPAGRYVPGAPIPPGGLVCTMNSFRRLRLVACPADWNEDGAPDFLAGDSGGTVYLALNAGKPGLPRFGYSSRATHALPLKVVRVPGEGGRPPRFETVSFLNYAMPFACDWDGDGALDLLLGEGTYSVNAIRLFSAVSRATPRTPPHEQMLYVGEDRTFLAPFAWDWDGDGDLDLFVCDAKGRLTVHRRNGAGLAEATDLLLDGGNEVLAYCTPQPCDWNADGAMDLVWSEPFGRIMVALGREKGGTAFGAPEPVRSTFEPQRIAMPLSRGRGRTISLAAVPARRKDSHGLDRNGGTADARRFYLTDGTRKENMGGWPDVDNNPFYGTLPAWRAVPAPALESQLDGDGAGLAPRKCGSWAIAPFPGDVWEVKDEAGAPGRGRTLLLRWHDPTRNTVFKTATVAPLHWTPGAAIWFDSGRPDPFAASYTKRSIHVKFHMKLDGEFSRLDVVMVTNWGPLQGGKPPVEGGSFQVYGGRPPTGQWFEVSHTEEPHDEFARGLDGGLVIELLGRGEIRLRDVRIFEGD